MKFIGLFINWNLNWGNDPDIWFTVDKYPPIEDAVFHAISLGGTTTYYWAEQEGLLHAYLHYGKDDEGFGGHRFNLKMDNGSIKSIVGPWDAGTSMANQHLPKNYVNIAYNAPGGYSCYFHGMLEEEICKQALRQFDENLFLVSKPFQSTGLSDEQGAVINHGHMKPNSWRICLDKTLAQLVPVKDAYPDAQWETQHVFHSIWGESIRQK